MSVNKIFIGLLNICSLYHKFGDILHLINSYSLKVFGLTETWLNCSIQNDELFFDNFRTHRLDRVSNKGCGLCLLVHKCLNSIIENTLVTDNLELLHVSLDGMNSKSLQIVLVYRRHTSIPDFLHDLNYFLSNVDYVRVSMILLGDFNSDPKTTDAAINLFLNLDTTGNAAFTNNNINGGISGAALKIHR